MSLTPETFQHELDVRFGEGYRLRWSAKHETWCIEQHTGRGAFETPYGSYDDSALRVRDGYSLVCEVSPRPWVECPECHFHLPLTFGKFKEVRCGYCESRGHKEVFYAGYFPLCEKLLLHLERTAPKRGDAWKHEMDAANVATRREKWRDYSNHQDAVLREWFPQMMQIPQVGAGRGGRLGNEALWKRLRGY